MEKNEGIYQNCFKGCVTYKLIDFSRIEAIDLNG